MKLNQIVAIEKGTKAKAFQELSDAHHLLQKGVLLSGLSRRYTPKDEDGETLPSESTRVQTTVNEVVKKVRVALTELFNVTATKDVGNTHALADVVIDGKKLISGVPATYLIFLEKQLVSLHTFVKGLPTLDPAEVWHYDPSQDVFATDSVETVRTKKVPRNHIKAEATDKHPAQVELWYEDVAVGRWSTIKFSGAIETKEKNEILSRVEKLQEAVKVAREEANSIQVENISVGEALFDYVLGK